MQNKNTADRSQKIIRTSVIGIVANVLLAAFKAAVGLLASSVAIVKDAVNNLSAARRNNTIQAKLSVVVIQAKSSVVETTANTAP